MITRYVRELAFQMGMKLPDVSLVDGNTLGCKDVHLLDISIEEISISTLIFQSDLTPLENGDICNRLEVKVRTALARLQNQLELER